MKSSILKFFTLFLSFISLSLSAEDKIKDPLTGETFPLVVSFEHEGTQFHLQATGVSTRKKFFVKVYSVASYLQDGADTTGGDKFDLILQENKAKQLTLKWTHNASAKKVQEGYIESFKNTLSENDYNQLQGDIKKYIQFFNLDVQKGDEHILRWLPGGYIEVLINGHKAGTLTNPIFAKGLWSIWFGAKSVVNRNNLTSLMK